MPRRPREFVDGGLYHVFNRGNNRGNLFLTAGDFAYFLKLITLGKEKHSILIFHYCLMTNHFHFLLQSEKKEGLSAFMHWLQLAYARYFKKIYQTTGHIFEERFRSPRIDRESYYLQCGRYIEQNPVKANMVAKPWEYSYSSALYYVEGTEQDIVTPNPYYLEMGVNDYERKENYKTFLSLQEPYASMIDAELEIY